MQDIFTKKRGGTAIIALLALGTLSGTAIAAGHGTEGGLYMGVDFGNATLDARAGDFDSFAAKSAGGESAGSVSSSRLDHSDTGWSLVLWGMQERHFGMEVAYHKLGTMAWKGTVAIDGVEALPVNVGISSSGWSGSAVGIWAFNDRLQLEGRAGAYFGKARTGASFPAEGVGTVKVSEKDPGISPMLGANLVFFPSRRVALNLGYVWFSDVAGKSLGRASLGARLYLGRGGPFL